MTLGEVLRVRSRAKQKQKLHLSLRAAPRLKEIFIGLRLKQVPKLVWKEQKVEVLVFLLL